MPVGHGVGHEQVEEAFLLDLEIGRPALHVRVEIDLTRRGTHSAPFAGGRGESDLDVHQLKRLEVRGAGSAS